MKKPEEIKLWVEYMSTTNVAKKIEIMNQGCPYQFNEDIAADALALIQQLEEDKKRLQERICNQRRQLRVLHAMYEWALGRLQKAKLNDRAHFQAFLRKRGYDLATMELPEVPKEEPC